MSEAHPARRADRPARREDYERTRGGVTLSLAFLEHAPGSAAQVLQDLDASEAAAFLDTVPARFAAPVINGMMSWAAGRCLARLETHRAAAILRELVFHESASVLRLIPAAQRDAILAELPEPLGGRLRKSFAFPTETVGAWADPNVPILSPEISVAEALRHVRECRDISHIFLHSTERRFAGVVSLCALLRSDGRSALAQLPHDRVQPVSGGATLASVALHAAWDEMLALPVVDRRHTVLGGLSRGALRTGLDQHRTARGVQPRSIGGHLLSALLITVVGLSRQAAGVPLVDRSNAQQEESRAGRSG